MYAFRVTHQCKFKVKDSGDPEKTVPGLLGTKDSQPMSFMDLSMGIPNVCLCC